jgi:hypothetical protein
MAPKSHKTPFKKNQKKNQKKKKKNSQNTNKNTIKKAKHPPKKRQFPNIFQHFSTFLSIFQHFPSFFGFFSVFSPYLGAAFFPFFGFATSDGSSADALALSASSSAMAGLQGPGFAGC